MMGKRSNVEGKKKSWWSGDNRVDPFMKPVSEALDRSGLVRSKRIDVYNRAYEAIYKAILQYGDKQ